MTTTTTGRTSTSPMAPRGSSTSVLGPPHLPPSSSTCRGQAALHGQARQGRRRRRRGVRVRRRVAASAALPLGPPAIAVVTLPTPERPPRGAPRRRGGFHGCVGFVCAALLP
eukprot:12975455-Alexandrium_andersonii.AAC.1